MNSDRKVDYYVGLDMGTGALGCAVTDTQYRLMKVKGKDFHRFFIKPLHIVYVNRYLDDGDKYILVIQNSNVFTKKVKEYEFKVNKEDVLEFEEI